MTDDRTLLAELGSEVERLLDRHLESAREWFPHQLVPWSRGRDYAPGEIWDPEEYPLPDPVRSALFVNLLTEDNLPYYFATIERIFASHSLPGGAAWGEWARRWTAEEMRHATVIRDWLMVTRALDPEELERGRMHQVSNGIVPQPASVIDGLVYVTLQELATQVSHRNTGRLLNDKPGAQVMARVAGDEALHHAFYRDLTTAALELDPSGTVCAIERQVRDFAMPGTGIIDFDRHAAAIASVGIYDFGSHHDSVLVPVLDHWQLESVEGLSPDAEEARRRTFKHVERVRRAGERMRRRQDRDRAQVAASN